MYTLTLHLLLAAMAVKGSDMAPYHVEDVQYVPAAHHPTMWYRIVMLTTHAVHHVGVLTQHHLLAAPSTRRPSPSHPG